LSKYCTIRQLAVQHPALSEPSIRWMLVRAADNGLTASGAILRNGRRVFIDAERFFAWLAARQSPPGPGRKPPRADVSAQ
jgi:hypothetical protein